jgi:hypothetical protein
MLTARNFVALTIAIAVVSIAWGFVSLNETPDSGGLGKDSYGTRAHGQRAQFEILADLGIPVERSLAPPTAVIGRQVTLVLWKPQPDLVQIEPAYLRALANWVDDGGRVVVAPDSREPAPRRVGLTGRSLKQPETTVLGELGLPQVAIHTVNLQSGTGGTADDARHSSSLPIAGNPSNHAEGSDDIDFQRVRDLLVGASQAVSTRAVAARLTGAFSEFEGQISTIEVPDRELQVIDVGESAPDGTIAIEDQQGNEQIVAALFHRGKGELVVVGCPAIAENFLVARHDNGVLVAHLLAAPGRPVVFDEFYHGLTLRGNPLWLFSQQGYAATALCFLLLIGLWIWREAVFLGPPLDQTAKSRRSIGEYVEAMARFFNRGAKSQPFLLREVRQGVLHSVRNELRLPPAREQVEELAAVLARRDPRRARELIDAVSGVDEALSGNQPVREAAAVELFKRMSNCL